MLQIQEPRNLCIGAQALGREPTAGNEAAAADSRFEAAQFVDHLGIEARACGDPLPEEIARERAAAGTGGRPCRHTPKAEKLAQGK